MTPKEFVKQYKPFALESEKKTGISHLFILAQAALESGWGERGVGNNFFGIKVPKNLVSNTPANKKQLFKTTEVLNAPNLGYKFPQVMSIYQLPSGKYKYEVKDWFRKYDTPEECFTDHAELFFRNKRYAKALLVKADPYKFAEEVAKAGYATATNYADSLKKIIKMLESYE
ncbi:peptidoglycan hydrolase [Capnocytophaga sputigena]|uniref:Peptidoglycan hydrolase n=1 Tax=Capnocytophaga sputigena TaxID=1019 RepID=A0A250F2G5_CAPSP|nr:glucosaminidase domain-containing protein [Capnocytophaga sputigena]ATA79310.1 peptidoglycan hydrolase [Capnocytophaga sputigena]